MLEACQCVFGKLAGCELSHIFLTKKEIQNVWNCNFCRCGYMLFLAPSETLRLEESVKLRFVKHHMMNTPQQKFSSLLKFFELWRSSLFSVLERNTKVNS